MKRFRITVNQAAIAANRPAIHVHDLSTDYREDVGEPLRLEGAVIVQGEALQDGARVWVEADRVSFVR